MALAQSKVIAVPSSTRLGALEHAGRTPREGPSCPGLCPAPSGGGSSPQAFSTMSRRPGKCTKTPGKEPLCATTGKGQNFYILKTAFSHTFDFYGLKEMCCFIKIISAFYDSCRSLDPELPAEDVHLLKNNMINQYILEHAEDATQQNRSCRQNQRQRPSQPLKVPAEHSACPSLI